MFKGLRAANRQRQAEWPGGKGVDLAFRAVELGGEVGEALNWVKKLLRALRGIKGNTETTEDIKRGLAMELGDVAVSLDLLAMAAGVDLRAATVEKFNATSIKHGLSTRMRFEEDGEELQDLQQAVIAYIIYRERKLFWQMARREGWEFTNEAGDAGIDVKETNKEMFRQYEAARDRLKKLLPPNEIDWDRIEAAKVQRNP